MLGVDSRVYQRLHKKDFLIDIFEDSFLILDPRSQRAGSYKIGAVIVNV